MSLPSQRSNLMTRRQSLKLLAGAAVVGVLGISGCGGVGGGSGGSAALVTLTGQLSLPAGVAPAEVQVTGAGNFGSVSAANFAVEVQSGIPGLVTVWNPATQKLVLMGVLDPRSGSNRLDAGSTAAAILFLGLGGLSLNGDDRRALLGRIAGGGGLASLTAVLDAAYAADPYALASPPAELKSAIVEAVQGFGRARTGTAPAIALTREGRDGGGSLIQLEPTGEVDGFTFVQASNPDGYAVQNVKRRYGLAYTYVSAHVDASDVESAESPPKPVGSPQEIPMTVGLLNTSGQGWAQVTSKPVELSLVGQDSKTKYEMVALAPVFGGQDPPIYSDPRYAGEVAGWKDEAGKLRQSVLISGFMELVLEILGLGGSAIAYSTIQSALAGLLTSTQVIRQGMTAAYLGNVFYQAVIGELASKMTFEEIFLAEFPVLEELTLAIKGAVNASAVRNAFLRPRLLAARAALVAIVALGIIELTDVIAIARDTTGGSEANKWTGVAFKPRVELSVDKATMEAGDSANFTVRIPSGDESDYRYKWKVRGGNGVLGEVGSPNAGQDIETTTPRVNLLSAPGDQEGTTYVVTVEAIAKTNGASLGTATKSVKIQGQVTTVAGTRKTFTKVQPSDSDPNILLWEAVITVEFTPTPGSTYFRLRGEGSPAEGYPDGVFLTGFDSPDTTTPQTKTLLRNTLKVESTFGTTYIGMNTYEGPFEYMRTWLLDWTWSVECYPTYPV